MDKINILYKYAQIHSNTENVLSDIVWCYCQHNSKIRDTFFHFMFPNKSKGVRVFNVYREVVCGDGRNDFHFVTSSGLFVVESKINDRNYEPLERYLKTNTPDRLAYIIGHENDDDIRILKRYGIKYKFWNKFAEVVEDNTLRNTINIMIRQYRSLVDSGTFEKLKDDELFEKVKNRFITVKENNDWHSLRTYGYFLLGDNESFWFGFRYSIMSDTAEYCFGVRKDKFETSEKSFKYLILNGYFDEYNYTYLVFDKEKIEDVIEEFIKIYNIREYSCFLDNNQI